MSEWQPIESAPKKMDTSFLVFDGIGVWLAWINWSGDLVGCEADGDPLPANDYPPTHWMPLPKPPM